MEIQYSSNARKHLKKIPMEFRRNIVEHIHLLQALWPDTHGKLDVIKLTNRDDYRMRVGRYRVLFLAYADFLFIKDILPRDERTY